MNFLSSLTIKHEKNSIAIFNLKIMKLMEFFFFPYCIISSISEDENLPKSQSIILEN